MKDVIVSIFDGAAHVQVDKCKEMRAVKWRNAGIGYKRLPPEAVIGGEQFVCVDDDGVPAGTSIDMFSMDSCYFTGNKWDPDHKIRFKRMYQDDVLVCCVSSMQFQLPAKVTSVNACTTAWRCDATGAMQCGYLDIEVPKCIENPSCEVDIDELVANSLYEDIYDAQSCHGHCIKVKEVAAAACGSAYILKGIIYLLPSSRLHHVTELESDAIASLMALSN